MTIYAEAPSVADDVRAAASGDQQAWDRIVERFAEVVWEFACERTADAAVAAEVSQITWLRLADRLELFSDPDHLGDWLADTARRESQRVWLIRGGSKKDLTRNPST